MKARGVTIMWCRLKGCPKCRGDLVLDGDEWRCWQCGQYYYPRPAVLDLPEEPPQKLRDSGPVSAGEAVSRPHQRAKRAPRNINSLIMAKDRSDRRWWRRNKELIQYLDEGRTIREISLMLTRGERQIRGVRERLHDLRAGKQGELTVGLRAG